MAKDERVGYLDGLRGIAVLLVVLHHLVRHTTVNLSAWPIAVRGALEGSHGVDLFFVLSGFCLAYPTLRSFHRDGDARFDVAKFFAKRIVRIVPPFYAALALFGAFAIALAALHVRLPAGMHPFTVPDFFKQALFIDWRSNFLNGSFWTLFVEFRWYFLFPLVLWLWLRSRTAFVGVAAGSTALYAATGMQLLDAGTLMPFMLGIAAADLRARNVRIHPMWWLSVPALIALGMVMEPFVSMPNAFGIKSWSFVQTNPGWQLAMFAFVVCAGSSQTLRSRLAIAPLTAVGAASYSIYLVHEPIVAFVQEHLTLPAPLLLTAAYGAAVAAGFIFWRLFERAWTREPLKGRAAAAILPLLRRRRRAYAAPAALPQSTQ